MTSPHATLGRKQVAYLAGPMRGIPEYNFPAFYAAADALRKHGLDVWSPAEHDVNQDGFDPAKDTAQPMRHYMRRDLPAVLDADIVCVLPGWEKSQGAQLEVHVAQACGIPVYNAHDFSPVSTVSETAPMSQVQDPGEWNPQGIFDSLDFASHEDAKKAGALFYRLIRDLDAARSATPTKYPLPPADANGKRPRLFYWEDAEDAWCPAEGLEVDNIISTDLFMADGEIEEIKFKRMDMTDAEFDAIPEG